MKPEYRFSELGPIEGRVLSGLALPYNRIADVVKNGRRVRERFSPGSAHSTGQACLNVQHERGRAIARQPDTLTLEKRAGGLFIHATLPETREADDTLTLVKSKILRGLSIEFHALKESRVDGVRVIQSALITGVGVVDSGAYPGTSVDVRGMESAGELIKLLRADPVRLAAVAASAGMTPERLIEMLAGVTRAIPDRNSPGLPLWAMG